VHHLGIDVHKRDSQIAVLDDSGELVAEQRINNDQFDEVAEADAGSKAAFEATGNYCSIYDMLSDHLDVQVADPRQTKAIGTAEVKNDRLDTKLLAQLCRADIVAESYVPPEDIRELRSFARGRKRLVEKRTDFKKKYTHSPINRASRTTGIRSVSMDDSVSTLTTLSCRQLPGRSWMGSWQSSSRSPSKSRSWRN